MFVKYDKNGATHYLLIIQSFALEPTSSVSTKNPFEFIVEAARLAKQDEPSFALFHKKKKSFLRRYSPLYTIREHNE